MKGKTKKYTFYRPYFVLAIIKFINQARLCVDKCFIKFNVVRNENTVSFSKITFVSQYFYYTPLEMDLVDLQRNSKKSYG